MPKPSWITIRTTSGSNNGTSQIVATAYTGRAQRSGVITGQTTGGVSDTSSVVQSGKAEHITITTKSYSVGNNGGTVEITGVSNSAALSLVGSTRIDGATYALEVNTVPDESWNGSNDVTVDGDPGSSAEYNFKITATYPVNHTTSQVKDVFSVKNGSGSVTSGDLTITQAAGVKTYSDVKITLFNYTTIPASGGSVVPTISYSQTWGWNGSTIGGGTITSGASVKYSGSKVNSATGEVTASSKGTVISGQTNVDTVTVQVTLNGKSTTDDFIVKQAENAITNYGEVIMSGGSVVNIPASGGTASQVLGYRAIQTITYSSNETRGGEVSVEVTQTVTAESLGTTVKSETKVGTLILTATGEGNKTATKEYDVYQAANAVTSYGEVTLGINTPIFLNSNGQTYQINPQAKQTVTYTSGASRNESSSSNPVNIDVTYTVKTPSTGFSLDDTRGTVTVTKNPGTTQRGGFVVTISATGEGSKKVTKDVTFNQQGSSSSITLTPETLEFENTGGTQTLNITSNDSWTLS